MVITGIMLKDFQGNDQFLGYIRQSLNGIVEVSTDLKQWWHVLVILGERQVIFSQVNEKRKFLFIKSTNGIWEYIPPNAKPKCRVVYGVDVLNSFVL